MRVTILAPTKGKKTTNFYPLILIKLLNSLGHQVNFQPIFTAPATKRPSFYTHLTPVVGSTELIIIEASSQSLDLGFIIAKLLNQHVPLLILTTDFSSPFFEFLEQKFEHVLVHQYDKISVLAEELPFLLRQVPRLKEKRFNLLLTPSLARTLKRNAQRKKLTKSQYVRELVLSDSQLR